MKRPVALISLLGMGAVFVIVFSRVSATNFSGYDEWLYVAMAEKGILGWPYANRPLVWLWHVPPSHLWPHSLAAYCVAYWVYLMLGGALVCVLCRRLIPADPHLAYIAAVATAIWAPLDHSRLNTVGLIGYAGFTMTAVLAIVLFLEAHIRGRALLLLPALALVVIAARGTEATVPLLAVAPLVTLLRPERRRWWWIAAWTAVVLLCGLVAARALLGSAQPSYQSALGFDPHPGRVLLRLLLQFSYHLFPLATTPWTDLAFATVPLAAAVFAVFFVTLGPLRAEDDGQAGPVRLRVAALGLVMAAAGYGAFVLSGRMVTPERTQFLAGPGIAILLATVVTTVGRLAPPRLRQLVVCVMASWIVAVAAGRTASMQREWTAWGSYPAQWQALVQLTEAAPDLQPNTLVLLLDDRRAFPASFTLRHAVDYLYQGRALAHVWGASDYLYPIQLTEKGIACEPWEIIRDDWRSPPTFHRYDEVLVAQYNAAGTLKLLTEWPRERIPLPAGVRYEPLSRIVRGGAVPPERAILGHGR